MKMRRIAATLLVLALLLVYLPARASAAEVASGTCGDSLTWQITDDGTLTISGTGAMEDFEGFLAPPWMDHKQLVKKIVVEEGVTYLGDYAFYEFEALTDMNLPDSLTGTGDFVFEGCSALTYIDFPASEVMFGNSVFSNCNGLTSITIPEHQTFIGDRMFSECTNLQTVNVPGNLEYIGYNAFYGYTPLTITFEGDAPKVSGGVPFGSRTGICYYPGDNETWSDHKIEDLNVRSKLAWIPTGDIPETVLTSGQYGMNLRWELTNLGKLTLSGTGEMESIIEAPWSKYLNQIHSLKIESGITELEKYAFNDMPVLMDAEIGDTVKMVGHSTFSGCSNLKSITFLGSVEEIDERAFFYCTNLKEIKFCGDAPKKIAYNAFSMTSVVCYYPADNDTWGPEIMLSYDGSTFWEPYGEVNETIVASGDCGENLTWKLNSRGGLTISGTGAMPDFYNGIAPWAAYKDQIKTIKILAGVTHIGAYAFYDYASVYRVSLGTTLVSIGEGAFYGNGLTSVIFPNTLQTIGEGAFAGCFALPKVEIPAGVTNIGFYAFSGCSSLTWISVDYGNQAYKSNSGVLYTKDGYTLLQCPSGYNSGSFHVADGCIYVIPEAFAGCNTLTHVNLHGVEILGAGVFIDCKNLQSVEISGAVLAEIPAYAFAYCESLKRVTLHNGVARVAEFAFQGCASLEEVTITSSVNDIGEKAFDGCAALKKITFEGSVPNIAPDAFTGVTAKAIYPYNNETWVSSARVGYGGTLTWEKSQKPLVGIFMSGECTSTIDWVIYNNGLMVISGYGAIPDYTETTPPPWCNFDHSVSSVVIEQGITAIGLCNFMGSPVKSIEIPASVTHISADAILNCNMLRKITVSVGNKNYASDSGVLYNKAKTELLWCPRGYTGDLVLAPTTQSIQAFAFRGCRKLTSVVIPASVRQIGDYAFMDCIGTIQFVGGTHTGLMSVSFEGNCPAFGTEPFKNDLTGVSYPAADPTWGGAIGQNYGGNLAWIPVCTTHVFQKETVEPDCIHSGSVTYICTVCGEKHGEPEVLPPQGHDYGLDEDGNPDFWDTTCDVCGAERKVDKHRPTHSMYRMYNPNTGEHFYTGDKTERKMLEDAGWKYEGVGFTFPASTGKPVYRLFQPSTGEHLYTMDENEKAALLAAGWNYEGVAFNSGYDTEVPQYRLYNPNVTVGAYHFTASLEEKSVLLAAGWQDQGIGFYTCWQ